MRDKTQPISTSLEEIDSDISMAFKCPFCDAEHHETYNQYEALYVLDIFTDTVNCDCGAVLECEFEIEVRGNIECTPPKNTDEGEYVLPGPNQFDLFTGKTIAQMELE